MPIKRPKLHMLPASTFKVDGYAQRTYDDKWAKHLADNWNTDGEGVYRISRRGPNADYVFDGQHRLGARKHRGTLKELVPALVYEGLTIPEEAALFRYYNIKTRKPNPIDDFRLAVVEGDTEATEIQKILDEHGLKMQYGAGAHQVSAVGSLRWLYREGGTDLLDDTLTLGEEAWPGQFRARDGSMLKGLGYVLLKTRRQRLDLDSLVAKLAASGNAGNVLGKARSYREATGRTLWLEVAHVITTIYNSKRSVYKVTL